MGQESGTSSSRGRGQSQSQSQSQSQPQSICNSQTSHITSTPDQVVTPPASDTSGGMDGPSTADAAAMLKQRYTSARLIPTTSDAASRHGHLHHLSAVAAAQDRLNLDPCGYSRKRMAGGEVKDRRVGSMSPVKGHSRTTSAVSVASTTGSSTIGELSAELRTRLSYAMVKVNHGWQGRSLDEVEGLASQAASPTSSTSTLHRRNASLASPRLPPIGAPSSQVYCVNEPTMLRRNSKSPPPSSSSSSSFSNRFSNKPALAPPVTIQPSIPMSAPRSNPRRNSNPRSTPTRLSHSHSASSSAYSTPISIGYPQTQSNQSNQSNQSTQSTQSNVEPIVHSPHKNVREQDAIETLLFMSSPGNSANLKHSFSSSASPGSQPNGFPPRSVGDRHALPSSGSRRGLPSNRPPLPAKKVGLDQSPGMPPPQHSPMDLDSPQQQQYHTPNRAAAKRHAPGHHRSALSLPSGLGLGNGTSRKILRDEDIERMLDRAGAEQGDSSDDEEIQLPPGRNGLARVMGA